MGEVLVVGAGLSGLYAALLLSRRGRAVRVIERGSSAGGLAGRELFRGVPCDLGSHRLHAAALERPLFREMHAEEPLLDRPRRGVLLVGDRRVPYPPTALSLARALGPRASLALGAGLALRRRQRRAFAGWDGDRAAALGGDHDADVGFERFVVDRVGEAAYAAFYRPYAEKVWGLHPAELSQTVAKKRVSSTHPWRLFRSLAMRTLGRVGDRSDRAAGSEDAVAERFLYPAGGTSAIIGFLERRLAELGVPIERGRAYRAGDGDGPVLFAGDLADLVPTALEHRGLYLVYVAIAEERGQGRRSRERAATAQTYYAPDGGCWFGRVSEISGYSPALRSDGETILCVEVPEGRWGPGLDFASGARRDTLLAQLGRAGIVPAGVRPIEVRQRFIPRVYPLYRRGWLREWRASMERVARLERVIPFGRQALFLHCNLDHCADIAIDAVAHLEGGGSAAAWIRGAERYLEIRVRD